MTFLADEQLRQAEDAFRRIDGRGCSLSFYLDYLATRPAQLTEFLDRKAEIRSRTPLDYYHAREHLTRLAEALAGKDTPAAARLHKT